MLGSKQLTPENLTLKLLLLNPDLWILDMRARHLPALNTFWALD